MTRSRFSAIRSKTPRRERGSLLVQAVVTLLVCVIALTGVELGYLFFVKREMQKAADLAALAGARTLITTNCAGANTAATANATQNLQSLSFPFTITPTCGTWASDSTAPQRFVAGGNQANAMKVLVSGTGPTFLPFLQARFVSAEAIAGGESPFAALVVRSTLASVDASKSTLLNSIFGGLLSGSLNLSAVGWDGLVKTDINLLKYLDRLAVNLGVGAGQYSQVLATNASVGTLIQTAIEVLQSGGGSGSAVLDAVNGLVDLRASIPSGTPQLQLGELIKLQSGTSSSALDMNLNMFSLVQGFVQLASNKGAIVADVPLITIPGFGNVKVKIKVIEPPQLSAIGDPSLAKADPTGPNQIYVRTAQIRTLIAFDLPGLSGITGLLNAVLDFLSPVTSLLNNVLSLNLKDIVCVNCTQTKVVLVPENPIHLDVNLDVAHGDGRLTDFNCASGGSKMTSVAATTAAAKLRIGSMTAGQEAAIFNSSAVPTVTPIPLMDVETKACRLSALGIPLACDPWIKSYRTGLKADTAVAASSATLQYNNPPNLNAPPPSYQSISSTNVIGSLSETLSGLEMQTYQYSPSAPNHFGSTVGATTQLVNAAISQAKAVITSLLKPLLDPLTNALLNGLGIDLAKTEIGSSLTCKAGSHLVY